MGKGLVVAAMGGALAGFGQGMAAGLKTEQDAEIQAARDAALEKREARLLALRQTWESGENAKRLEATATEGHLNRGAQAEQNDSLAARDYTRMHNETERSKASLEEQKRHNKAQEGISASNAATQKLQADAASKKLQPTEDGTLMMVGPDGKAKPVINETTGEVVKGTKDMSARDQTRIKALQGLIKEDTELAGKLTINPKELEKVSARIERNTSRISELLGFDDTKKPAAPAANAGGSKPWERKWTGGN